MDRNSESQLTFEELAWSLSARRAWIEMPEELHRHVVPVSLSARRAWIEIIGVSPVSPRGPVALRKESVDRNVFDGVAALVIGGRSPQGERG